LLKNNKTELIKDKYLNHFLSLNTWQNFEIKNSVKSLLVKGISNKGLLLLEDKNGTQTEFDIKEVKWIF
jgi:biotin-(acetyl-CoA carboxylase) ligase